MDQARKLTVVKQKKKEVIPIMWVISIVGDVFSSSQVWDYVVQFLSET